VEYQNLGVKFGLLINPQDRQVEIYQPGQEFKTINEPQSIDCGSLMPGLNLDLTEIW
jgi:Uma2 family endonuclease